MQPTQPTPSSPPPGLPVDGIAPTAAAPTQVAQPVPSPNPAGPPIGSTATAPPDNPNTEVVQEKPLWRRLLGFVFSWLIVPGILVLFVHNFVFQAWYVDGQSMEPTFQNGDYLIVSKWDASFKKLTGQAAKLDIKRGDVVIFNPPNYTGDIFFIKRAIGLPGERVVVKNGSIRVYNAASPNGFALVEPYTANIALEGDVDRTVASDELFVVGDNRNPGASHDSRAIGPIKLDHIVGTANLRLLPFSQFGSVQHPNYTTTSQTQPALQTAAGY